MAIVPKIIELESSSILFYFTVTVSFKIDTAKHGISDNCVQSQAAYKMLTLRS